MKLNKEQQEILDGKKGETLSKVMQTIIRYGELFGAEELVPVTSDYNHLVTSFGLKALGPVYDLMDKLIKEGVVSKQKFSCDPRPIDKNVPQNFLQRLIFNKFMYSKQDFYEGQLRELGLLNDDAFTCACYMDEVGNKPKKGEVLSWAESSAVVYANSVLGARCNRNSGMLDLFSAIIGKVPEFGLLTDEGRQAKWLVEIKTSTLPEPQLLGSAIGLQVMEDVPYIMGLDQFLGRELNDEVKGYLKDMGAAAASNGSVGLYHVHGITPEAVDKGRKLLNENYKVYTITDRELDRVYKSYPILWKKLDAKPKLCFIGCPHLSYDQLVKWANDIINGLRQNKLPKVTVRTILTTSPQVAKKFEQTELYERFMATGVKISSICPLMYTNNPIANKAPIITSSNKLRTYSNSRYYTNEEILKIITGGKKL